jgi:hypothetical protein
MVRASVTGDLGRNGTENLGKGPIPGVVSVRTRLGGGQPEHHRPVGFRVEGAEREPADGRLVSGAEACGGGAAPGVGRGLEAGAWTGDSKRLARLCGRAGETGSKPR